MDKVIPNAMKTYVREREGRAIETKKSKRSIHFSQDIVLFEVYNFRDT